MKRICLNIFILCVCSLAAFFVSCEKDDESGVSSSPSLTVPTSVSVSAEGGECSFAYSVVNPMDGGALSFSTDVSWLSNISDNGSTVSFTADGNPDAQLRGGSVTLQYDYSGGYASVKVAVVQDASGTPWLSVSPTTVTAYVDGGTYEFAYTISNPADDGVLSCSANVDWLGGFDLSSEGLVSFTVEESTSNELREGEITLTYSYYYSEISLSRTVAVVQDHTAGWDGTVEGIIGTYEATAIALMGVTSDNMPILEETTWTLVISPFGSESMYIQGITPYISTNYLNNPNYYATATMDEYGYIVIPSQFIAGSFPSSATYAGYTPCVEYDPSGPYLYYDYSAPDCTFAYDRKEEVWISDYGMYVASYMIQGWYYIYEPFDVTAPRVTMRKVSDAITTAAPSTVSASREWGLTIGEYVKNR
ncbi:MAG: hypothetical protein LUD72_02560 [Bacteroidales bacterium]|nr:hypothetical protein [Bacteroidales bacterium]